MISTGTIGCTVWHAWMQSLYSVPIGHSQGEHTQRTDSHPSIVIQQMSVVVVVNAQDRRGHFQLDGVHWLAEVLAVIQRDQSLAGPAANADKKVNGT